MKLKRANIWTSTARHYDTARALLRDRKGSLMATFAVAAPVVLGIVGLGVESGQWYANKRALQTQADAAALSGAYERAKGRPSNVTTAAMREATRNGFVNNAPNTAAINNPPATGAMTGEPEAVEVILGRQQTMLLSSIFVDFMTISARAVAAVQTTGQACVLALDPSMSGALTNTGNPIVDMAGCVMAANSNSATAINVTGSSVLTAESVWTPGGYSQGGSASATFNTPPQTNTWALDDPYEGLMIPPFSGCDYTNFVSNSTMTLNPGVYCSGFQAQSHAVLTLNPGTYYIDGGDLMIQGGAKLRCNCVNPDDGVTFVLTSSISPSQIGAFDIRGGADIVLQAPKTGPFAGVLFYQDRRATTTTTNKFNGGSTMVLTGAIYTPSQALSYTGDNSTAATACTQLIGKQVIFSGNSVVKNSGCEDAGIEPLQIVAVKVVE